MSVDVGPKKPEWVSADVVERKKVRAKALLKTTFSLFLAVCGLVAGIFLFVTMLVGLLSLLAQLGAVGIAIGGALFVFVVCLVFAWLIESGKFD